MTQSYSTESIQQMLEQLNLPFAPIFARALVALLTGRKISLHHVTHLMPGEQNPEANRQQIRRCLDHETLTTDTWARTLAALLPRPKWVLALDRTEWHRAGTCVNVLVLAVVIAGCAVPLLWSVLEKPGASDTAQRIALLQRFIDLFGAQRLRFVTADREFIGREWVSWLLEKKVPFRIRIKAGEWLESERGYVKRASDWFRGRPCACRPGPMRLWGLKVFVGGRWLRRGRSEFVIVIASEPGDLLEQYRLRWKIETLFQALKGRGFDLESCRLSQARRLSGWFGLLALGLCWCLKVGCQLDAMLPLPLKRHGRRASSVFPRGLQELQSLVCCLAGRPASERFGWALSQLCPQK